MAPFNKVRNAHQQVANALAALSAFFTDDAKLTFVMRVPGKPDCFMVIGDDEVLAAVAETVIRSRDRAEVSLATPEVSE